MNKLTLIALLSATSVAFAANDAAEVPAVEAEVEASEVASEADAKVEAKGYFATAKDAVKAQYEDTKSVVTSIPSNKVRSMIIVAAVIGGYEGLKAAYNYFFAAEEATVAPVAKPSAVKAQIKSDEALARRLQAQKN